MTTPFDPIFRGSCVDIHKADCETNTRLIDPCSCTKYFLCINNNMIEQTCAPGTAYDHTYTSSNFCRNEEAVYLEKKCNITSEWTRCKSVPGVTDAHLLQLEARCTNTVITSPTPGTTENGSNVGAIVGGILAGVVVIALIIICFILYKRGYSPSLSLKKKDNKKKRPIQTQPSINNPQYFGEHTQPDHIIYEEYSTIDDVVASSHLSNEAPRLPNRPPTNPEIATGTGDRKISTTSVQTYMEPSPSVKYGFDNPGLDISEENSRTNTANEIPFYTEVFPEVPSNGLIHLHNRFDDVSPYDNS